MGKSQQSRKWGSWITQLMFEQLCPTTMRSLELEILLLSTHGLDASAPLGTHTHTQHTHAIAALAIGNRHMTRAVFNTQLLIQSTKRGGLRSIRKMQPHRSSGAGQHPWGQGRFAHKSAFITPHVLSRCLFELRQSANLQVPAPREKHAKPFLRPGPPVKGAPSSNCSRACGTLRSAGLI